MNTRIRNLERYLACQIAQVELGPIADNYVEQWRIALQQQTPLPDPLNLIKAATAKRVPILAPAPLLAHIEQCASAGRIPSPQFIILAIVHGIALRRPNRGRACRCSARETLDFPGAPVLPKKSDLHLH